MLFRVLKIALCGQFGVNISAWLATFHLARLNPTSAFKDGLVDKGVITFWTMAHDIATQVSLYHTVTSGWGGKATLTVLSLWNIEKIKKKDNSSGSDMSSLKSRVN